jgi:hypothetical protein
VPDESQLTWVICYCTGSLYIVLTPLRGFELFFRRWLREHKNINIFVEPRVKKELLTEDSYYNFVQTWDDGKRFNLCDALLPCAPD